MHIFIPMEPPTITQQQHRIGVTKSGRKYTYEQQELKEARSDLRARLVEHAPKETITDPVGLYVIWCFPIKGKHKDGEWKTSKPDTDNLNKMLKDVMTELGWWKDDALVVSELIEKRWAVKPGIFIQWKELSEGIHALMSEPVHTLGHWKIDKTETRPRYYCSECGDWQTYGETDYCPNCGYPMEVRK